MNRSTSSAPYRLTRAKRQILATLAEYFCLPTKDIAAIIRGRTPTPSDIRIVNYSLGLLWGEGLVHRIGYIDLDRDRSRASYVYGLSDKGVKVTRQFYAGRMKSFDDHSKRTLDHELEISRFHIALDRFAKKHGLRLYWQQDDLKCGIHPDALFALTNHDHPQGPKTYPYFLEIERAKWGHYVADEPSIMRKLGRYYDYYNTDECEKEWNFRRFRVAIVQPNATRRDNLLAALRRDYNDRMFWLTTETLYREGIAGAIFKTPKDYLERSYSFQEA